MNSKPTYRELVEMYPDGEIKTLRAGGNKYGVSHQAFSNWVREAYNKLGLPMPDTRRKFKMTREQLEELTQRQGVPIGRRDIYGASRRTVSRLMKEYGLPPIYGRRKAKP